MRCITEPKVLYEEDQDTEDINVYLKKIYEPNLKNLLNTCYQCGCCSGVCQLSKVEKFTPSRIIQKIREGYEDQILESGILWNCLTCNNCLQNCPELISFAEIVRNARYKMRKIFKQNPKERIAHEGIYTTISEIMSKPYIHPQRSLEWIPKNSKISEKGDLMYYVGCLPFFTFEFQNINSIAVNTLKIINKIENDPIVILKEEICCGHDLYWGQGKFKTFIKLAKKNKKMFEEAGISTIITACAECYRTFKYDYPKLFDDFNEKFEVKHIIDYVYDNWKQNKIEFKNLNETIDNIKFTYHDPCRLSRFLPEENKILDKVREIFDQLRIFEYDFEEMERHRKDSLCCGISCWMNCNEGSKAIRYTRFLEAKSVANMLITSCPKCNIHFTCLQNDFKDVSSIKVLDFSEFVVNLINNMNSDCKEKKKKVKEKKAQ